MIEANLDPSRDYMFDLLNRPNPCFLGQNCIIWMGFETPSASVRPIFVVNRTGMMPNSFAECVHFSKQYIDQYIATNCRLRETWEVRIDSI